MRNLLGLLTLLLSLSSIGQEYVLKGQVIDASSGEPVVGAKVIADDTYKALSDLDGNYILTFPNKGEYVITVTMLMFDTQKFPVSIIETITQLDLKLGTSLEFEEVKVIGNLITDRKTPVAVTKIDQ
ncbi:MAG: carboxypeptidase-like regulatory domain-containing protein, partial [Emcibacteraceae bacterium]|nr:carboxypeptidase-like regulatory domain-containing protein [Emcibacteraceae bacterium]